MTQDNKPAPLQRQLTGIQGFEHISMGGLVEGRTTLLVGTSGSGKTLFANQFLYNSIKQYNRPVVFVTFEERPQDIIRNVKSFGWDLQQLIDDKQLIILDATLDRTLVDEVGQYDLSGALAQIEHAIKEIDAKVLILDSLGVLFFQYRNPNILRREILRVSDACQAWGVTSLMTAERLEEYGPITRFGIEEFVSDCVIVLRHQLMREKVRRTIQVYKLRGDRHYTDEFPFSIQKTGICILPLSAAELTQSSGMDRISFGNERFDQLAGGGFFQDSVILVSGPTGSGKTLFATTFTAEACKRGEKVLFIGFEESRPQLSRNAQSWGIEFEEWEQKGLLKAICHYPEAAGLEGHQYFIRKQIETFQPSRLVIDSVSALERIGNIRNYREFIIGLTGFVKQKQVCTLCTSSSPSLAGGDSITDAHISTITDAVVLLRYVEIRGSLSRGVIIIKMRGSQHDKGFHEFHIDGNGLHIDKQLTNVPSSLLGVPNINVTDAITAEPPT